MSKAFITLLCLALSWRLAAQITPAEGSKLNYTLICFSVPNSAKQMSYTLEIAQGNFNNPDSFNSNVTTRIKSANNQIIAKVPYFGKEYTWRLSSGNSAAGALHHFSTIELPITQESNIRLRVLQEAIAYKDGYVFSDASKTLYTITGEPVWIMPLIEGIVDNTTTIRDLKLSDDGTITFMTMTMAYEIDYNGRILWRAPNTGEVSRENTEHYHHELTKLHNGHYMTLGNELSSWEWRTNTNGDSSLVYIYNTNEVIQNNRKTIKVPFGTVIEYDNSGKLIWSWRYLKYFTETGLDKKVKSREDLEFHENAFFFEEKDELLYVSFKNSSKVMKIAYPQGYVANTYGKEKKPLFCQQHACKKSTKGQLYLFNNNFCQPDSLPNILVLEEPTTRSGPLKKIWQYTYPIPKTDIKRTLATTGGNVIELNNGDMFASMCSPYSNLFIVSKDKKIIWDALLEKWNNNTKNWVPQEQYRASIITSYKKIEQLIFKSLGGN